MLYVSQKKFLILSLTIKIISLSWLLPRTILFLIHNLNLKWRIKGWMHQHHLHRRDRFSGARNFTLFKCYFSPKTTCFEIHLKKKREEGGGSSGCRWGWKTRWERNKQCIKGYRTFEEKKKDLKGRKDVPWSSSLPFNLIDEKMLRFFHVHAFFATGS